MRARYRLLWSLAVWLFPAALTADLVACNDGSTGCCKICECACGDECATDCSLRCTLPKGCACSSTTMLTTTEPLSLAPDAGAHE